MPPATAVDASGGRRDYLDRFDGSAELADLRPDAGHAATPELLPGDFDQRNQ